MKELLHQCCGEEIFARAFEVYCCLWSGVEFTQGVRRASTQLSYARNATDGASGSRRNSWALWERRDRFAFDLVLLLEQVRGVLRFDWGGMLNREMQALLRLIVEVGIQTRELLVLVSCGAGCEFSWMMRRDILVVRLRLAWSARRSNCWVSVI